MQREPTVGAVVRRRCAAVLAWTLLGVTLVACSDDAEPAATSGTASSETASGTTEPGASDDADVGQGTQVVPTFGDDFEGIAGDVTIDRCTLKKGDAVAQGTVVNGNEKARDLLVVIVWLRPDSGDSLLIKYKTFANVPPGETRDWKLSGRLPSDAERCVLQAKANVVGTVKK